MKKNFIRMFAAILFCGAIATVFTACSKDDDDNSKSTPDQPKEEQKATKGDVTLTFIAQPKSLQYFEYDFKYVDAKGNTKTIDIDQDTKSSGSLDDFEFQYIKEAINALATMPGYADISTPFVYRVALKDQPIGGTVTYTTTCHVKEGASISETLQYALPQVISTLKLENDARMLAESTVFNFRTQKVTSEQWEKYVSTMEGKTISQASGEITVGK